MMLKKFAGVAALAVLSQLAQAQSLTTTGTVVQVAARGEVVAPNDMAVVTFTVEEQDKDKGAAASRVNQKMKQALDILKKSDPQAVLKTDSYRVFVVYPEERERAGNVAGKSREVIGWRVRSSVKLTTTNLTTLPATVASVQKLLALSELQFGLTPAAAEKLDEQRIAAGYRKLNTRVAATAAAMGRAVTDAVLESVSFDDNNSVDRVYVTGSRISRDDLAEVTEPSFEPGTTTLDARVVAKVKFK